MIGPQYNSDQREAMMREVASECGWRRYVRDRAIDNQGFYAHSPHHRFMKLEPLQWDDERIATAVRTAMRVAAWSPTFREILGMEWTPDGSRSP